MSIAPTLQDMIEDAAVSWARMVAAAAGVDLVSEDFIDDGDASWFKFDSKGGARITLDQAEPGSNFEVWLDDSERDDPVSGSFGELLPDMMTVESTADAIRRVLRHETI